MTALVSGNESTEAPMPSAGVMRGPASWQSRTRPVDHQTDPWWFPFQCNRLVTDEMNAFRKHLGFSVLVASMALTTACTSPGYNDNPSQQITKSTSGCPAAIDYFAVYFTTHLQPSNDIQDAKMHREIFRSYCNDIPTPGRIFLTVDLLEPELRSIPIGIRVMQHESRDNGNESGKASAARIVFEAPAHAYATGVIESDFEISDRGNYSIYLMKGKETSAFHEDLLEIPLRVGVGSNTILLMTQVLTILLAATGIALLGLLVHRYSRKRHDD